MSKLYNIRKLTSNNTTGDAHGITIPKELLSDDIKNTSYNIIAGSNFSHDVTIEIVDSMNVIFKQMCIEFPTEQYPKIKFFQLQLRDKVVHSIEPLKTSVILVSGCK